MTLTLTLSRSHEFHELQLGYNICNALLPTSLPTPLPPRNCVVNYVCVFFVPSLTLQGKVNKWRCLYIILSIS